jgi:hypothetical protein
MGNRKHYKIGSKFGLATAPYLNEQRFLVLEFKASSFPEWNGIILVCSDPSLTTSEVEKDFDYAVSISQYSFFE